MNKNWGIVIPLVALALLSGASAQPTLHGDWLLEPAIDPITDVNASAMIVLPTSAPALPEGRPLGVMCDESGTDGVRLVLRGGDHISLNVVLATYRVDDHPPVTQSWRALSPTITPFSGDDTRALFAAMVGAERLAIRYDAYRTTATYVFPIAGFLDALHSLGCYTGPL